MGAQRPSSTGEGQQIGQRGLPWHIWERVGVRGGAGTACCSTHNLEPNRSTHNLEPNRSTHNLEPNRSTHLVHVAQHVIAHQVAHPHLRRQEQRRSGWLINSVKHNKPRCNARTGPCRGSCTQHNHLCDQRSANDRQPSNPPWAQVHRYTGSAGLFYNTHLYSKLAVNLSNPPCGSHCTAAPGTGTHPAGGPPAAGKTRLQRAGKEGGQQTVGSSSCSRMNPG